MNTLKTFGRGIVNLLDLIFRNWFIICMGILFFIVAMIVIPILGVGFVAVMFFALRHTPTSINNWIEHHPLTIVWSSIGAIWMWAILLSIYKLGQKK